MKPFFAVAVLMMFLYACKDGQDGTLLPYEESIYTGYFPLDTGHFIIYDVDSTVHSEIDDHTNQPDTSIFYYHYQIMEHIDSAFTDGMGDEAFRVSRYYRDNETMPWDFRQVWVAKITAQSAQRTEDNVTFVRLSFPLNVNATWNGNAFNSLPEEDYGYTSLNEPLSVNGFDFDSSLSVLQFEDYNLIHRIHKEEKYANHVGMVYKEKDSLNINSIGQITNGIEYRLTLNSYGY